MGGLLHNSEEGPWRAVIIIISSSIIKNES